MGPESDVDRPAPIFFLSYSHSSSVQSTAGDFREPHPHVVRLFTDLSIHVNEMVPPRPGIDPGFMDQAMKGGERWNQEIFDAAGTCQVFLALISSPYLSSGFCAREWDAFSRRAVRRRSAEAPRNGTTILPVVWTPPTTSLPPAVRDVQSFTPNGLPKQDIASRYHKEGVYGLLALHDMEAYDAVVWRLAQRIVELVGLFNVEPRIPSGPAELRNVFRGEADTNE